ncbi:AAA family ATPase [Paenibacillus sp. GD4]|uniref:AAA family ATPase n=1 Tax=Paenibacillus sp. GD4 TaxID=3068890 RepID=UPI0027969601|nr:AAA family ATPase [Paenibacillus sp. GD4]MDQ1909300.1 AAA family ATPase [Paenibacillus sp. GD4]
MSKLVFFLGPAGAGKTTLAKAVAAKRHAGFFDMDTLLRPAAVALMTQAGLDPDDRDSQQYKIRCRDVGYRITMDAALENLQLGNDAFVVGPFTKETADPGWLRQELARIADTASEEVEVKVVYVYLKDIDLYRLRIQERGLSIDAWKLEHWEEFSQSLAVRTIAWPLPGDAILYYDNAVRLSHEVTGSIERFIYGETRGNTAQ